MVGEKNVLNEPLVSRERVILPPLHIKLGLMKQFVKAMDQNSSGFEYIARKMPGVSIEKLKAGIFDGPQIRELINDSKFTDSLNNAERKAWSSYVKVVRNFRGKHTADNYPEIVKDMLTNFQKLGCNMSMKLHFLHSHLDRFSGESWGSERGSR